MQTLRRPGLCVTCGDGVRKGSDAWWDPSNRTITCLNCLEMLDWAATIPAVGMAELDRDRPGASLMREYNRRRAARERRMRDAHPHVGGLFKLRRAPEHENGLQRGAVAEQAVAAALEARTAETPTIILYNRRMPEGRGDIDGLAIVSRGVFVIDTKDWTNSVRIARPLFGKEKLIINGRDHTNLVDGLERQIWAVREALEKAHADVEVLGALCFTRADLPLKVQRMRGHLLLGHKALAKQLGAPGRLEPAAIESLACRLAATFPAA